MRRFTTLTSLVLLLFLTCGRAAWGMGRFGATDLMNVPTSGTLSDGGYGLYGNFSEGVSVLGVDFGVATNLELGVTARVGNGWQDASLRVKYHLLSEKRDGFGLAVGIQDVGQYNISPYVVAGMTLTPGLMGYLGVGGGYIEGVFFGLSMKANSLNGANLFLEYDSESMNLGGRFILANNLGLDVAFADLREVVVGLSYVSRF